MTNLLILVLIYLYSKLCHHCAVPTFFSPHIGSLFFLHSSSRLAGLTLINYPWHLFLSVDHNILLFTWPTLFVTVNLESVKLFMQQLELQFSESCDQCKVLFKPWDGEKMEADIPSLIDRVELLRTNISNLMLARVPRLNMMRSSK